MNTPVHSSPTPNRGRIHDGPIVRVLQAKAGKLSRAARLAMNNPTRRSLLKVLTAREGGIYYHELIDYLPVSERWTRELVADLRRAGIVKTPGSPALIQFTSHEMMIAVEELLAFLAADWVENVVKDVQTALETLAPNATHHYLEDYLKTMSRILRGTGG